MRYECLIGNTRCNILDTEDGGAERGRRAVSSPSRISMLIFQIKQSNLQDRNGRGHMCATTWWTSTRAKAAVDSTQLHNRLGSRGHGIERILSFGVNCPILIDQKEVQSLQM